MARPAQPKKSYRGNAHLARPKKIISRHCPAGPAPEFTRKSVGYCVSPLRGFRKRIYRGHRRKNISRHLAWSQRKKSYRDIGRLARPKQNHIAALAAGWMSDLSRYDYFFAENYRSMIFRHGPDALGRGQCCHRIQSVKGNKLRLELIN